MKLPRSWLSEWVDTADLAPADLGARLTMAGFELEALAPVAGAFTGVVVAAILEARRHPQADKLQVCRVSTGAGTEPLQIVCGAANARAGLRVALATVGAVLPGDLEIKAAKLRGVESFGMLCSARELGLAEASEGILELPADAPLGRDLREFLALDDISFELNVTPNRGDALSVLGLAREVAAITGRPLSGPKIGEVPAVHASKVRVRLEAPEACPRFLGRVVLGVNNRALTPLWMKERLRRAGQRSISPVVDVTNYVLLELGQPMHAYDLGKLKGRISARLGRRGERCALIAEAREIEVDERVLVIADDAGPVGLAGVMGGSRTAVSESTTEVFLEAAWFAPEAIAGRGRRYGLTTDSSQRFERGVDPEGQRRAIERATGLLLEIAGGEPGPVVVAERAEFLPKRAPIELRYAQVTRLLGREVAPAEVQRTLGSLGIAVEPVDAARLRATVPSHRFDLSIERDLIEEVGRLVGYDSIPETPAPAAQRIRRLPSAAPVEQRICDVLAARGFHEAISFAFVDPALQTVLFPDQAGLALVNPIASDLAVMRLSLWPGLLRALRENLRRQQDRVRLFELGVVFLPEAGGTLERRRLAGLAAGPRSPEQWGAPSAPVDFYDLRADLEALLAGAGSAAEFRFEPATMPCLHPGRSARILRGGCLAGWVGELHPRLVRELDLTQVPQLFELDVDVALTVQRPSFRELSRFPQVRRDIALVVDDDVLFSAIRERVTSVCTGRLRELRLFDVYRGEGVEKGRKSVAIGLIFQDDSRTLTDDESAALVAAIKDDLRESLKATIRE